MNNPYSDNRNWSDNRGRGRGERWGSGDYRGARSGWRDEGSQYAGNRSNWGEQGGFSQSRPGQDDQDWQSGANYDDFYSNDRRYRGDQHRNDQQHYGSDQRYGNEQNAQRSPWNENFENYGTQQDYSLGHAPGRSQSRGENQRWGQGWEQGRNWRQSWQNRPQGYNEGSYGYGQTGGGQYDYGGGSNYGGEYGYGRGEFSGSQTGARAWQESSHRGKGPKDYMRTDERIREEICECLSDDPRIDASEISVQVRDGIVMLDGSVQDRAQKHRAEDIADGCNGVKDVHNGLRVTRMASSSSAHQSGAYASGQSSGLSGASASGQAGSTGSSESSKTQTQLAANQSPTSKGH